MRWGLMSLGSGVAASGWVGWTSATAVGADPTDGSVIPSPFRWPGRDTPGGGAPGSGSWAGSNSKTSEVSGLARGSFGIRLDADAGEDQKPDQG